jgi:PBSX family phage terminase large subunit
MVGGGLQVIVAEHRYRPLGTARELFACREPEVLVSGPAGTGKSRACLEKMHRFCLVNAGVRCLIVRKTATSLTSTALSTFRQYVATEALQYGDVEWYGGSKQEPAQYRYTNGSTILVAGMDQPTRIMSSEYDMIYVQEATELTIDDWEHLLTRLRNGRTQLQQILADCNPSFPTHWLKLRADQGLTKILESRHEENPRLFTEAGTLTPAGAQYMEVLDKLTGVRHARLRRGQWVSAEGVIYEDFDGAIHVVDAMPRGWEGWERYWAVDFGFTNPFVCQFWAESPDGDLYLYREIYRTQQTVEQHVARIKELVCPERKWLEPKPQLVLADHDAEGRQTFTNAIGLPTTAAKKQVTEGIQAVQERMRLNEHGHPRVYFVRGALVDRDEALVEAKKPTCTIEELPGYIWDIGAGKNPKEQPVKINDHGADAMRYMVAHRDLLRDPQARFLR